MLQRFKNNITDMDKEWGKVFVLDLRSKEEIEDDYPLPSKFTSSISHYYTIDKGVKRDRVQNLKNAIRSILEEDSGSIVTLHIVGHWIVPDHSEKSIGIEFLYWEDFSLVIQELKMNKTVFINMLGVCFSNCFTLYTHCYDKIWYASTNAESIEIPTDIYWNNYFNDFGSYLKRYDVNGYFGFSIEEVE